MPASIDYGANAVLSGIAVRFRNKSYIADRISPVLEVGPRSGIYYEMGQSDYFDEYEDETSDEGWVTESKSRRTPKTYTTVDFSHSEFLPELVEEEGALIGLPEIDLVVERVAEVVQRKREIFVATKLTTTGNYPSGFTAAVGTTWATATVKQIAADINAAKDAMCGKGNGRYVMAMGLQAWRSLSTNTNVVANWVYTVALGQLMPEMVAQMFGLDEVIVGDADKNTANVGADSPTRARIWGNFAVIAIIDPNPSMFTTYHNLTFRRKVRGLPISTYLIPEYRGAHNGTLVKVSMTERPAQITNNQAAFLYTGI